MQITIVQALLLALYLVLPWPHCSLSFSALPTSLWVGIVLGNIPEAVMIGVALELVFMGATGAAGGVAIQDPIAATLVVAPMCILSDMEIGAAIALAVPLGLCCAQLQTLKQTVNSIAVQLCDKRAAKGHAKGFVFTSVILPKIIDIICLYIPVAIIIYVGGTVAGAFVDAIPDFITNALSVVGSCMPAVGFGIILYMMGSKKTVPFMLAGFFLVQYSGVVVIPAALVGAFIAFLFYIFTNKDGDVVPATVEATPVEETQRILTKRDLTRSYWRWQWFENWGESWERKLAPGFCYALMPGLRKFYKEGSEEMSEAMTRHMAFFNTEGTFGACIPGIVLAMEEQKSLGAPISGESISAVKNSLMGPFAGIGDALQMGCIYLICDGLFIAGAANGSGLAAAMSCISFGVIAIIISWYTFHIGYKQGSKAAVDLLKNGTFSKVIPALTVMGMFMVGALAASYVTTATGIIIPTGELGGMSLQGVLDSIVPGLLPLGMVGLAYFVTKKGKNFLWTALTILAVSLVCGIFGILC